MKTTEKNGLLKIVIIAMLSAVSFVLFLFEFPIVPSMNQLKLDLSDIPALLAAVLYGPAGAVVIELIKNLIELLVKGMGSQMGFGNLMNFIVGCAYLVPFGLIYKKRRDNKGIIIACAVSVVSILLFGLCCNYFIAPPFFKAFLNTTITEEMLWGFIGTAELLNLIKGIMLSILSIPVIKVIIPAIKKAIKL